MGQAFNRLHDAGVRVSLDDYDGRKVIPERLESLQVDMLKVGRGFMRDLPGSSRAEARAHEILTALCDFSGVVIAERVESRSQVEFLQSENCYLMQGNYFCQSPNGQDMGGVLLKSCVRPLDELIG